MSRMSKIVIWLVGIMVLSFVAAGIAFAATDGLENKFNSSNTTHIIDEENTFKLDGINEVNLDTVSGDINFIPVANSDEIVVHYHGETRKFFGFGKTNYDYKAEVDDHELNVNIESKSFGIGLFRSEVTLDIYIPDNYANAIDVETVSGDIFLEQLTLKTIDVSSTSGNLKLTEITSPVINVKSISGDLEFDTVEGNFEINTTSGDFNFDKVKGDFDLKTTSGDIDITYSGSEFNNDIEIDTVSGDIELNLPDDSTFALDIHRVSGDIDNELGSDPHSVYKITINTVSGDVELKEK